MKTRIPTLVLALTALGVWGSPQATDVISERGSAIEAPSPEPEKRKVEVVTGGFDRDWETQPPLIPHAIDKYSIDMRQNGCMKCHSETTAEKEKTKPTPESHYLDRDGKQLESVSARRYFCTQCHTPQLSGAPLVENTFGSGR